MCPETEAEAEPDEPLPPKRGLSRTNANPPPKRGLSRTNANPPDTYVYPPGHENYVAPKHGLSRTNANGGADADACGMCQNAMNLMGARACDERMTCKGCPICP